MFRKPLALALAALLTLAAVPAQAADKRMVTYDATSPEPPGCGCGRNCG